MRDGPRLPENNRVFSMLTLTVVVNRNMKSITSQQTAKKAGGNRSSHSLLGIVDIFIKLTNTVTTNVVRVVVANRTGVGIVIASE